MKKILISIIIFSFLLCGCQKTTPLSHKEFCLDTIVQITLYDSSSKNILNNCGQAKGSMRGRTIAGYHVWNYELLYPLFLLCAGKCEWFKGNS